MSGKKAGLSGSSVLKLESIKTRLDNFFRRVVGVPSASNDPNVPADGLLQAAKLGNSSEDNLMKGLNMSGIKQDDAEGPSNGT